MYISTSKTRGKARQGIMLTREQVSELKSEKNNIEQRLKQTGNTPVGNGRFYIKPPMNRDDLRKKIKEIDNVLESKSPPEVNAIDKGKLWNRAKTLIENIKEGMPTKYEMHPLTINPATGKLGRNKTVEDSAVRKNVKWQDKNKPSIVELKNIARTLGHPEIGNVEKFRPKGTSEAGRMVSGAKESITKTGGKK